MSDKPTISEKTRTIIYCVLLAGSALGLLAEGLAAVWADPDLADKIAQTATVAVNVLAVVGGGLGVVYRPTRPENTLSAPRHARSE